MPGEDHVLAAVAGTPGQRVVAHLGRVVDRPDLAVTDVVGDGRPVGQDMAVGHLVRVEVGDDLVGVQKKMAAVLRVIDVSTSRRV